MSTVETVRGPIDTADLGPTLLHEHIFVDGARGPRRTTRTCGVRATGTRKSASPTRSRSSAPFATRGSRRSSTRPPPVSVATSRAFSGSAEVDLNIVVATGIYAFLQLPNFLPTGPPRRLRSSSCARSKSESTTRGQGGLSQVLRRGARFDRRCSPHFRGDRSRGPRDRYPGDGAHERVGEDRADRARHADEARRRPDADRDRPCRRHQRPRLPPGDRRLGAALGFDRFNIPFFNPDADRVKTLAALVTEGYTSTDPSGPRRGVLLRLHDRRPELRGRDAGLPPYLPNILPQLLEAGVTQAQIDEMLTANAARFFA